MSAYDITEFLRTAYRPFAYCEPSKFPLNTAYQRGGVTLIYSKLIWVSVISKKLIYMYSCVIYDCSLRVTFKCKHHVYTKDCYVVFTKACFYYSFNHSLVR